MGRENNEKARISVVMPTYNTDISVLGEAVMSILNQTFSDFEFIIVDDCSQNGTQEYLQSIQDDRVKVIRNFENLGVTKSLNIGLKAAEGEYIARMDADDIALPTRFEKQLTYMENHPEVIACGTWIQAFGDSHYTQKRKIPGKEFLRCSMLFGNFYGLSHPTAFFRASALRKYAIEYDEKLPTAQDYGIWSICCEYGELANVPEVLLAYRVHKKQISVVKRQVQIECVHYVQRKLLYRLGIETEADIQKHFSFCDDDGLTKAMLCWARQLKIINSQKRLYDKKEFEKAVSSFITYKMAVHSAKFKMPDDLLKLLRSVPFSLYPEVAKNIRNRIRKRNKSNKGEDNA